MGKTFHHKNFNHKSFFSLYYVLQWILLVYQIKETQCHGKLLDPPARNSMWRFGYPNPVDYQDNELFCGGRTVQWSTNGGKCGVCGDPWDQPEPREHEDGGKFGNGIITRRYTAGQDIDIEVELTANHKGTFKFKLCAPNWNKYGKTVTQECFDQHPLYVVHSNGSLTEEFVITNKRAQLKSDAYFLTVRLPLYVTCTRCILQWTYRTGNSWGYCGDGVGALGCGPQETFVNCADVSILSNTGIGHGPLEANSSLSSSLTGGVSHYGYQKHNPYQIYYRDYSKKGNPIVPLVVRSQVCLATGKYRNFAQFDQWCMKIKMDTLEEKYKVLHAINLDLRREIGTLKTQLKLKEIMIEDSDTHLKEKNEKIYQLEKYLSIDLAEEYAKVESLKMEYEQKLRLLADVDDDDDDDFDHVEPTVESLPEPSTGTTVQNHIKRRNYCGPVCSKCGVQCGTKKILLEHTAKNDCPDTFDCQEGPRKYASAEKLRNHIRNVHSGNKTCDVCNLTFENNCQYRSHQQRHHGKLSVQCPVCKIFFVDQEKLDKHHRVHEKNKTKAAPVILSSEDKELFDNEMRRLIAAEEQLKTKFTNPTIIFAGEEEGIVKRSMDESVYKFPSYLFYASYTPETSIPGARGHFMTTNNLNPYIWYIDQLTCARNRDSDGGFCRHTRDCTLQGQITDWDSVILVCAASGEPIIKTVKFFCNQRCEVSNIVEGADKKWQPGVKKEIIEVLKEKTVPLMQDFSEID